MTVETPDWLTVSDATVSNGITQITITVIVAPLGAVAIAANALGITAESHP